MNTSRLWNPLHLELMIHYFVSDEPFDRISAPAVQDCLGQLERYGLLDSNEAPGAYSVTDKGAAFVERLCRTELPVMTQKRKVITVEEWE